MTIFSYCNGNIIIKNIFRKTSNFECMLLKHYFGNIKWALTQKNCLQEFANNKGADQSVLLLFIVRKVYLNLLQAEFQFSR